MNYLLYQASTAEDVNATAFSLLKYLGICNLKPPSNQELLVYTTRPALLEAYGPFFNRFQMKDPGARTPLETVREACASANGSLLYLAPGSYPVQKFDSLFSDIDKGAYYANPAESGADSNNLALIGINPQLHPLNPSEVHRYPPAEGYISQTATVPEFNELLRRFFTRYGEESVPNLVRLAGALDLKRIKEEKLQYSQLPLWNRLLRRVGGKGWHIGQYVR